MTKNLASSFSIKTGIFLYAILFLLAVKITAQEVVTTPDQTNASNFSYSGSIDTYYRYGIDSPNRQIEDSYVVPGTAFANRNGFALGMLNLNLEYTYKNTGVVADLVIGPRGEEAVFLSEDGSQVINQLYVYWNLNNSIKFTLGNFNTFLGYEVISPKDNFNYSTSYMFSYGPFSHTGIKADFKLNASWSLMLAVLNPTDFTESNPFDTYILGGQLGYSLDKYSSYLNFRYGNEGAPQTVDPTFQVDWTTGFDFTNRLYAGLNATYLTRGTDASDESSGFYGIALYSQYSTSDRFAIGIRGEYFSQYNYDLVTFEEVTGTPISSPIAFDDDGDGEVIAITLTGNYTIGNLALKPELRMDYSEDTFIDSNYTTSSTLSSFLIAAIYKF
ncbi:outer membrane beta-barrel protein [Aquimarina sp. 2-A2]|uniref:outer membrane beta-barrel protein n=1 Tax=Aquimarina sp. 2-A2 TaxID=3382644 RepID=UPI00387F35F9